MEKIIKARKEHICQLCDQKINKGEMYVLHEVKGPVYEDSEDPEFEGPQVSVYFYRFRNHLPELRCDWIPECKEGNHSIVKYFDADPNSETCGKTFEYCENCSTDLRELINNAPDRRK